MMIRPARDADLDPIARIYEEVLDQEDARPVSYTNWQRGRYPTRDTARQALEEGTLWVLEEEGAVCGCVNLNGVQLPEYSQIPWSIPAAPEEVGVIHTLVIRPSLSGRGLARRLVNFCEEELRRQTQEFEWAYGDEAEERMEQLAAQTLQTLEHTESADRPEQLEHLIHSGRWHGEIDRDAFQGAVDALTGAHRIYILGVRSSSALANFLGFYFNLLFDNVTLVHTNSVSEIFEQVLRIGPGDVLFGISFPRYSKRTLSAMQYARDRGAKVIALTDSQLSPLARVADHLLLARSDMASFVDSLVAPLSVINALIVAVGMSRRDEIEHTFNKLESIWEKYDVYEKPEDDTN